MTSMSKPANARPASAIAMMELSSYTRGLFAGVLIWMTWLIIAVICTANGNAQEVLTTSVSTDREPQNSIHELLQQLESKTFAARTRATEKLIAVGSGVLRPLARNLRRSSPEVVYRSRKIMRAIATGGDEATFLKAAGILKLVTFGTLEGNSEFVTDLERQWKTTRTANATKLLRDSGATVVLQSDAEFQSDIYSFSVTEISETPAPVVATPKRLSSEEQIQIIDRILVGSVDNNRELVFSNVVETDAKRELAELKHLQQRQLWNNQRNLVAVGQTEPIWGNSVSFDKKWDGDANVFSQINALENLSAISIRDIPLNEERVRAIAQSSELQQLTLERCQVSRKDIEWLENLDQLTQLSLVGINFDGGLVEAIHHLSNLQTLKIENCEISDRELIELANFESLIQIFFKNQDLSAECLSQIGALKQLRYLELNACDVDVATVKGLRKRKELKVKPIARAFMGVRGPTQFGDEVPECVISEVVAGSGAEKAGLQSDDVITHINGQEVESFDDLILYISQFDIGDQPTVRIRRGGTEIDLQTELSDLSTSR